MIVHIGTSTLNGTLAVANRNAIVIVVSATAVGSDAVMAKTGLVMMMVCRSESMTAVSALLVTTTTTAVRAHRATNTVAMIALAAATTVTHGSSRTVTGGSVQKAVMAALLGGRTAAKDRIRHADRTSVMSVHSVVSTVTGTRREHLIGANAHSVMITEEIVGRRDHEVSLRRNTAVKEISTVTTVLVEILAHATIVMIVGLVSTIVMIVGLISMIVMIGVPDATIHTRAAALLRGAAAPVGEVAATGAGASESLPRPSGCNMSSALCVRSIMIR